jgi:hypothetical protein
MIYGDFDPKQFAVDAKFNVKLVDIDAREVITLLLCELVVDVNIDRSI